MFGVDEAFSWVVWRRKCVLCVEAHWWSFSENLKLLLLWDVWVVFNAVFAAQNVKLEFLFVQKVLFKEQKLKIPSRIPFSKRKTRIGIRFGDSILEKRRRKWRKMVANRTINQMGFLKR